MKSRSWFVLMAGFGTLLVLTAILGFGALNRSRAIYDEMEKTQESYIRTESALRSVPADLYLAGLLIRDYLLDPSHLRGPYYQQQLDEIRGSLKRRLDILEAQPRFQGNASEPAPVVVRLRKELDDFWKTLDPVFAWTPQQKAALSYPFLRQFVLPRTQEVLVLSREIRTVLNSSVQDEHSRMAASQQRLEGFLTRTISFVLGLGIVVAGLSIYRVRMLEQHADLQRERILDTEEEMRRLSRKLVQAQEQERKALSRELHDEVGQLLTGMGMELSNLESRLADVESGRASSAKQLTAELGHAMRLNQETLRRIRNLSMGLRPSMLDDLGLGPALDWQAREFSRRSGVPVTLQVDGEIEALPEAHRTCIYRIVQEALTNCARHSKAHSIRVSVYGRPDWVSLTIQDDGIGFQRETTGKRRGLGLIGIQERVRELEGRLTIVAPPDKGTMLQVELPIREGVPA